MTYKILFVDDEAEILNLMSDFFDGSKFELTCLDNPKAALQKIRNDRFDLIISDHKMPDMTGIELLKAIREVGDKTLFLFLTGYVDLLDAEEALKLGAEDILVKPFSPSLLAEKMEKTIVNKNKKMLEHYNYKKVSIDNILDGRYLSCDRYIKIGKSKFVPVAYSEDEIDPERIQIYKDKGVKHLYINENDFQNELSIKKKQAKEIAASKDLISKEVKTQYLSKYTTMVTDQVLHGNLCQDTIEETKECLSTSIDIMSSDNILTDLFKNLSKQKDFLNAHSVGVSIVSFLIAKKLDIFNKQNLINISLGGLLHDIGKTKLDSQLYSKSKHQLSSDEKLSLEKHPMIGYELVKFAPAVPEIVHNIIYQHHEDCMGTGYPLGLKASKIAPSAKIIQIANIFCNLTITNPCYEQHSIGKAIQSMDTTNKKKFDSKTFAALKDIYYLSTSTTF